jgi:hypothetical protein
MFGMLELVMTMALTSLLMIHGATDYVIVNTAIFP